MLAMVFVVLGGFALVVWNSFRVDRRRAESGQEYAPDGAIRWGGSQDANA